jgi:signal transduction histidine kinase/response regulator RpfG family c-di-GMP phosphodiesterase
MIRTDEKPPVLIVDDEPRILDSLRDLLEDQFEVVASTDPEKGLEILRESQVAVILADQRMPGLTGDQFLAKAQQLSDATRILITGYADIDALIRAVNHGQIYTYVPKPWEPAQLQVTVFKAAKHSREMTHRKKAAEQLAHKQRSLAESEAAFRRQTKILQSILDSMGDGVLVADEHGKMMLLNPAAERMVGPGAAGTPQQEWGEKFGIYQPETMTVYPADELPLARAMRGESADHVELYVRNPQNPSGIFVSVNTRPLKDDSGEARGGVAVVRDITLAKQSADLLRKAKEEAERANHAKSEFLSRMSHELRTPLNSILGFAQILEMGAIESDQQDCIDHVMKGGQHLLGLINEVLDLSRIEAGRLSLSPEPVELREIVEEALSFVHPMAQNRNILLQIDAPADCERYIKADRQRLKQVLLNLFSNAVKYNVDGGRITIGCEEREEGWLRITVTDTGIGISEEDQQRLFQPFNRIGHATRSVEGTGLGLAISKRLMEAMGGRIGMQSAPGAGSTFWIELNSAGRPSQELPGADLAHAERAPSYSHPRTVLYVEDNPTNFMLMERIVALRNEVSLVGASEARSGLELAQTNRPDLILLDLHLPDASGHDVLRRLKEDPNTSPIPVVVVSADATPVQINLALEAGACRYLTKPLDVGAVLRAFDDVFAGAITVETTG